MKILDIEKLNQIYTDAENVDKEIFSEMRSNMLLVAGEHYSKNSNKYFARLRETNRLSETQKLRLTKNHIHKICRHYKSSIVSKAPDVKIIPANEAEMQDRKNAELNSKVWKWGRKRYDLREWISERADDYIQMGEVACKIFWDPEKGDHIGWEPKMREGYEHDQDYEMDGAGNMVPDDAKPVFSGDFVFEPLQGFNLMRDPAARSMRDTRYIILRKMVAKSTLMKTYEGDPEKLRQLTDSRDKTYIVFDTNQANYNRSDKEVLIREIYYKPCMEYPNGYFYIFTDEGILEHGELPYGIFPIVWKPFDVYATSCRGKSIVKVARPYQAEINRASSQLASHQITVGDDKVLYQAGTKLAPGALLPGVRGLSYQGAPPIVMPGRDGSQFIGYIEKQIAEMYDAVMLSEINTDAQNNLEPYTLLFRSMSQQAKFKPYIQRFESFLVEVAELYLKLAMHYLPDNMLLAALGRNEQANMQEFRNVDPLSFSITLEPGTESADTMLGKQMTFQHMLQYVGKDFGREDIGKIMKNMPFVNNDEIFDEFTVDYDNVTNDMLAIERGEQVGVAKYANNEYYIKRFTHRMKKPDYKFLDPMIQQMYQQVTGMHEQEVVRKQEEIRAAQSEQIPTDGAMVTCSIHIPDPANPGKTKQLRLPYSALMHLVKQMEDQGKSLETLEGMNQGALADMARQLTQQQQMQNQPAPMPQIPGGTPPNFA